MLHAIRRGPSQAQLLVALSPPVTSEGQTWAGLKLNLPLPLAFTSLPSAVLVGRDVVVYVCVCACWYVQRLVGLGVYK